MSRNGPALERTSQGKSVEKRNSRCAIFHSCPGDRFARFLQRSRHRALLHRLLLPARRLTRMFYHLFRVSASGEKDEFRSQQVIVNAFAVMWVGMSSCTDVHEPNLGCQSFDYARLQPYRDSPFCSNFQYRAWEMLESKTRERSLSRSLVLSQFRTERKKNSLRIFLR